jgi:hypothetical protein
LDELGISVGFSHNNRPFTDHPANGSFMRTKDIPGLGCQIAFR